MRASKAFLRVFGYNRLLTWRDGRAVECTGLENRQGVKPFQGSNPCLSAILII